MRVNNLFSPKGVRRVVSTGIAAILFSVFGASASAQLWNGAGGDDNWLNGANWVGGIAPTGITHDAVVGAPSPAVLNGNIDVNSLTVAADGIINFNSSLNLNFGGTATTTLNNSGTINTGNNTHLQFRNGVVNSGNININASSSNTDIEIDALGATLDGGGTVTLSGTNAGINGLGGSTLTIVDQTIQGQGRIGENLIGINNQANGLIDANVSGEILEVDANVSGASNAGVMQASGEGTLRVVGTVVDNTGGQIVAGNDSEVRLFNSTVSNGTLSSLGTGQLTVDGSSDVFLENVTINGSLVANNNSDTGVTGTITNTGTIQIAATSSNTDLEVQAGGATLTGGGTLQLSGGNAGINGLSGTVLTIGDQTIEGEGSIGENTIGIVNSASGLIDANVSGNELNIDSDSTNNFTNNGVLRASNGGELRITSTLMDNNNLIEALEGSKVELNDSTITGGTLRSVGSGSVELLGSTNVFLENLTIEGNMKSFNNSDTGLLGTINNSGLMDILATSTNTDIEVQTGNATLTGGGTVKLSGGNAGINGLSGTVLTIGDQTIEGEGSIGENTIGIINSASGLVDANVSGETLQIDADSTNNFTNNGVLRASGGGELRINGTMMDNNNMIEALEGSKVELDDSTIIGGTLRSVGTGSVELLGSTNVFLESLSIEGNMKSFNNSDTGLSGVINNSGLMEVLATSSNTDIEVQSGGATLTGGGTVRLSGANAGINGIGLSTLDIASQLVIGQGSLGENTINILNGAGGTIEADIAGLSLVIDTAGANDATFFTNDGTLRASNGAILDSLQGVINNGTIDTDAGSTVKARTLSNNLGSLVSGDGLVDVEFGTIAVAGVIAPGNSAGTLTLLDDTFFSATAELQTELESALLFDVFSVVGELTLDGSLSVDLLGGYNPLNVDSFLIASATDGIMGEFSNVSNGGMLLTEGGEGTFVVNYNPNGVVLSGFTLAAVPEPSAALCLIGLGLGLIVRRRRQA